MEINYFTEKEARRRDRIVRGYFGENGIEQVVKTVVSRLISSPKLKADAKILDVGAGSGIFTLRVADALKRHLTTVSFYAMDATPAMLLALDKKTDLITPFFGIAENIAESVQEAREYAEVPARFDALFSTLMLHHCPDVEKVMKSMRTVLKDSGKVVIIDLCSHNFTEFRHEMGDVYLGFDPKMIRETAKKMFSEVTVKKLRGICCKSSGRRADLFVATLIAGS